MKAIEAKEALVSTLENISDIITEAGLSAQVRCGFTDLDFDAVDESVPEGARVLFGDILVSAPGVKRQMVLECAVGIDEGEVTGDELLREIGEIRAAAKELAEMARSADRLADVFEEDGSQGEADEVESSERDDTKGKIFATVGLLLVAAAILFIILR